MHQTKSTPNGARCFAAHRGGRLAQAAADRLQEAENRQSELDKAATGAIQSLARRARRAFAPKSG